MKKAAQDNDLLLKQFSEEVWLNYFNKYLFENGVISESNYSKMTEKIAIRCARFSNKGSVQ